MPPGPPGLNPDHDIGNSNLLQYIRQSAQIVGDRVRNENKKLAV